MSVYPLDQRLKQIYAIGADKRWYVHEFTDLKGRLCAIVLEPNFDGGGTLNGWHGMLYVDGPPEHGSAAKYLGKFAGAGVGSDELIARGLTAAPKVDTDPEANLKACRQIWGKSWNAERKDGAKVET